MNIQFDSDVGFEGALLIGWANVGPRRIRCVAGRETINELERFKHATASQIHLHKREIFEELKPTFVKKIESRELDNSTIPTVTVYLRDLPAFH